MYKIKSITSSALLVTLSIQLFSCGYLLHPERRGQKSGQIDWAIAGLDAIGLLFFILPGLIAFGVDIASGTIYMAQNTPGLRSDDSSFDLKYSKQIKIDQKNINKETIAAAIKENTGIDVDMNDPRLKVYWN